jgi:EAL domain-containing protein (putative c-di-GMP-specific phosphodiesterase class I)/AmiR/NasT family two-component response regulator
MEIGHLHLLVAESDQVQRRALIDMLTQLGATKITEAPDGHTALRCFQDTFTTAVDIAVINLDLPGMDGLELLRQLAAIKCTTQIIIVAAQTNALLFSVETMAQAYGVDLLGTIGVPITAAKLNALLDHYVAPSKNVRPKGPTFSFAEIGVALQARQFEPFFQPKIELETGQVKGLEAFARWRHPDHGVLGPGAFIDALEQHNRIDFLDWTMIERSVAACRGFHDQGIPISISINLATETIAHPSFMQQIAACMGRHRILPDYVTFEMPESSVLTNDPNFLERLVRLRMLGYGLAIDDYGTGRSNLQLLARIPFSELKIDRSFVDGASKKRAIGVVLSSCLGLARSLDRKSVAVGVETKKDWDFLQGLGCTYAQGYHIAKPMEASALREWLEDWQLFF